MIGKALPVLAWAAAVGMCVVAWMRWFGPASNWLSVGLVGLTPFALAPAWILAAYAIFSRHRALAAIAIGLVLLHASWVSSDLRLGPGGSSTAQYDLRLASANMLVENPDPVGLVLALLAEDPDIIFLQEARLGLLEELQELPEMEGYQWVVGGCSDGERERDDSLAIISRLPIQNLRVEVVDGNEMALGTVTVKGVAIELTNVHLSTPLDNHAIDDWNRQLLDLSATVNQRSGPMLLAGDFNATVHHKGFRILMSRDLTDAHQAVGRGLGFTWGPRRFGIPVMRIDHVLSTPELKPVRSTMLDSMGSDHRPLVVDYCIGAC